MTPLRRARRWMGVVLPPRAWCVLAVLGYGWLAAIGHGDPSEPSGGAPARTG